MQTNTPSFFETFVKFDDWRKNSLTLNEPACFNEKVSVKRYLITVEEIEEPVDVITARLQKLWDESNNYHDADPIMHEAKLLNYKLIGTRGSKAKKC